MQAVAGRGAGGRSGVIGRVYRGGDVGGLLRYLYGPGRHTEHEAPHLVAAWDLESAAELATLENVFLRCSTSATPLTRLMSKETAVVTSWLPYLMSISMAVPDILAVKRVRGLRRP